MFDSMGAFSRQFTPVEGGYLYYPSGKGGGKLVTSDEYEQLLANWRKVAGRSGTWKVAGTVMLAIFLWTLASEALSFPDWSNAIMIAVVVTGVSAWLLWASFAPRRLVRDRPAIAPPRDRQQAKREASALLNWRFIIFAMLLSGLVFLGSFASPERNFVSWVWLIGSGTLFGCYIWISILKFRDG